MFFFSVSQLAAAFVFTAQCSLFVLEVSYLFI